MRIFVKLTAILSLALCLPMFIGGCGGGGGTTVSPVSRSMIGTVALPPGVTTRAADLTVVTCENSARLNANGGFSVPQSGSGLATVYVTNGKNNPLLFGFVDASATTKAVAPAIDVNSTASALLFMALGAYTLPRDQWAKALELINARSETADLAAVIAARMLVDPMAVGNGDEQILTAVWSNARKIVPAGTGIAATRAASKGLTSFNVTARSRAAVTPSYTVTPINEASGVLVAPSIDGNGITITNYFRRHINYFIYRTGYKASTGAVVSLPYKDWQYHIPTASIGDPGYISATTGVSGLISSLIDTAGGNVPYAPQSTSSPEVLPTYPDDAKETYYKVIVIGPSFKIGDFADEVPPELQSFTDFKNGKWQNAYDKMAAITFAQELLFPMILTFVPFENFNKTISGMEMGALAQEVISTITQNLPSFGEYLVQRNWKTAGVVAIKQIATSSSLRAAIFQEMVKSKMLKGAASAIASSVALKMATVYLTAVDKFMSASDMGAVTAHLSNSDSFAVWGITGVAPNVHIQPNLAVVKPGNSVNLTCYGVDTVVGTKEYIWTTEGIYGHLADSHGNTGKQFSSSDQTVAYVSDGTTEEGAQETVYVTANLRSGNNRTEIGSSSAIVIAQQDEYQPTGSVAAISAEFIMGPVKSGGNWIMSAHAYIAWKGPRAINMYISARGQKDPNGNPIDIGRPTDTWYEQWGSPVVIGPEGSPSGPGTQWANTFGNYNYFCVLPGYHVVQTEVETDADGCRGQFQGLYNSVHANNIGSLGCSAYVKALP